MPSFDIGRPGLHLQSGASAFGRRENICLLYHAQALRTVSVRRAFGYLFYGRTVRHPRPWRYKGCCRRAHEPRRADGVRRHPLYRLGPAGRAHPLHGRRRHRVWPLAHRPQGARHDLCRPGRWQQARRAYRQRRHDAHPRRLWLRRRRVLLQRKKKLDATQAARTA